MLTLQADFVELDINLLHSCFFLMIFMSGIVLGFTVQNMNLGSMVLDEMAFQAWATGLSVVGHTLQM